MLSDSVLIWFGSVRSGLIRLSYVVIFGKFWGLQCFGPVRLRFSLGILSLSIFGLWLLAPLGFFLRVFQLDLVPGVAISYLWGVWFGLVPATYSSSILLPRLELVWVFLVQPFIFPTTALFLRSLLFHLFGFLDFQIQPIILVVGILFLFTFWGSFGLRRILDLYTQEWTFGSQNAK